MELVKVKCLECGANLEVDQELDEIVCNYCGTKVLIDDEATKIHRIEKAKLESRKNNYEQTLQEKKDKDKYEYLKWKKEMKIGLIALVCMFGSVLLPAGLNWVFTGYFAMPGYKPNPSLAQYNSLNLGMTYNECKEVLGIEGHLIFEEKNSFKYVWYDVNCSDEEECDIIIELNFEDGKLVSRNENGLE